MHFRDKIATFGLRCNWISLLVDQMTINHHWLGYRLQPYLHQVNIRINASCIGWRCICHYDDVIMAAMASQITSLTIVYSTVYSGADQSEHQSSASLAFVWGIHRDRWIPRTNGQKRGKCFHLMTSSCLSPICWVWVWGRSYIWFYFELLVKRPVTPWLSSDRSLWSVHQEFQLTTLYLVQGAVGAGQSSWEPPTVVQQVLLLCKLDELLLEAFIDKNHGSLHLGSTKGVQQGDMFFHHDICYTDGATAVDAHLAMDQAAPALTTRPVNKRPRVLKVHQNGVAIVVMGLELFVRDPSFLWVWAVKTVSTLVVFLPRTVQHMCDSKSLEHVDFVCILLAADEDVVEELSRALRGTEATEVGGQHVLDPLQVLLALGVQRHRGWQLGPGVTRMMTEGMDLDLEVKEGVLTHLPMDKMATILQTTFSNAFWSILFFSFRLELHWTLFLRVQLTISQHCFRLWIGAEQAASHYSNQCWPSSLMHICGTRGTWVNPRVPG